MDNTITTSSQDAVQPQVQTDTKPANSRYFEKTDEWNMLHAFKFTPGKQVLHLNVTMLHINALEPSRKPTPDMDEISEAKFNEYKYDVLSKLDVI